MDREAHSVCVRSRARATRVKQMRIALLAAHEVAQRADAAQTRGAVVKGDYHRSPTWLSCDKCGLVACSVAARRRSTSVRGTGDERPTYACEHEFERRRSVL